MSQTKPVSGRSPILNNQNVKNNSPTKRDCGDIELRPLSLFSTPHHEEGEDAQDLGSGFVSRPVGDYSSKNEGTRLLSVSLATKKEGGQKSWKNECLLKNKKGMEYLKSKGPIFSNPVVLKFIALGKHTVKSISDLKPTQPSRLFRLLYCRGVENSKGVLKYIEDGKLTIQQALKLTRAQASILDDVHVQQYIDSGELKIEDAIKDAPPVKTNPALAMLAIIAGLLLSAVFGPVGLFAFLTAPLAHYAYRRFSNNTPYPSGSVMHKACLHLPEVRKHIVDEESVNDANKEDKKPFTIKSFLDHLHSQPEHFHPKNLCLKSIQEKIENGSMSPLYALQMSPSRAYAIEWNLH